MRTWEQIAADIAERVRPAMPGGRIATSEEVGIINDLARLVHKREAAGTAIGTVLGGARTPTALRDPVAFYGALRASLGPLDQPQVDGFNALLEAMGDAGWPLSWAAYGLATAWHETARTMQPVREAYWLSEDWRQKNLRYFPWYGRGFVQITWEDNYKWADKQLGLNGELLKAPDLALDADNAAVILVKGMEQGAFSKDAQGPRSLPRFLPNAGAATREQFRKARPIVNLMDKAADIAGYAVTFQVALEAGGWG